MKIFRRLWVFPLFAIVLVTLGSGCASTDSKSGEEKNPPPIPLPEGVALKKDKDIQGVWLSPDFSFKGYDSLYVAKTVFHAVERPNEVKMREWAMPQVQMQEIEVFRNTGLFKIVTADTNQVPVGGRNLRLENTIIDYEKGGGAARYWAGIYGAGQPIIKIRGLMYDGDKLVFIYEARRSGDSGTSRMFGGFMGDDTVQQNDIHDLSVDLAGFIKRTAESK